MTVLIVGAGAAGLTAAFTLLQEGYMDFKILEASDRLGGRLKKLDAGSFASFPIDLGAEWLHVEREVLEEISQDDTILDRVETILHVPDSYPVWEGPQTGFGIDYMDYASASDMTDYLFVNYTWFDFFNDTIAVPQVRDSIIYNCPITMIDYSGTSEQQQQVTATCQDGATYEGSHIMVTAPLQILKDGDITFVPELPDAHLLAIENITMPPGYKIFLKFRQDFYPQLFESSPEFDPIGLLWYDETYGESTPPEGEHIMGIFVSDEAAKESASWDDDTLLNYTLGQLDQMFEGNATKYFVEGVVQNWVQEPYIRGTYSHYSSWQDIDQLKIPIGSPDDDNNKPIVFLAGEAIPATDRDYGNGYAHGAALSGKETAEWILAAIKQQQQQQEQPNEQEQETQQEDEESGASEDNVATPPPPPEGSSSETLFSSSAARLGGSFSLLSVVQSYVGTKMTMMMISVATILSI